MAEKTLNGTDAAVALAERYEVTPEVIDGEQMVVLRAASGGTLLIKFRTVADHDCADVRAFAPDGTPMSLGVFTISDGRRGPSEFRKGHGWDGGDMVALLFDPEVGDGQTAARRESGDDY